MPATVKGGFFEQYGTTLAPIWPVNSTRRRARQALSKYANFSLRERMRALTGANLGLPAIKTLTRVAATEDLSGKRPTEVQTFVNRNTTSNDITEIQNTFLPFSTRTYNSAPIANGDGNPLGTR
jgi:hypothetical protein